VLVSEVNLKGMGTFKNTALLQTSLLLTVGVEPQDMEMKKAEPLLTPPFCANRFGLLLELPLEAH